MGRRIYSAPFDNATIPTTAGDIRSLKTAATKGAQIHHIQMSAGGVSVAAEIRMRLKRGTGTIAGATGGSVITVAITDFGDTLPTTVVAHLLDTTAATATAFTSLEFFQWNVLLPFDYMPGPEDEDRDVADISQILVLDTPAAITATVVASGFAKWREMP